MTEATDVVKLLRELIKAENNIDGNGRTTANRVLHDNFAFTPSHGEEKDKKRYLLNKFPSATPATTDSANDDLNEKEVSAQQRDVDGEPEWWSTDDLSVTRSVVRVGTRTFRNTHVFIRQDERWQCISWQVTEFQGPPVKTY